MQLLQELEQVGYQVALEGDNVRLTWCGAGKPDPATVKPLLEELRRHKEEVLALLAARQQEPDYEAEVAKAAKLLRERGWCVVWSRVLGEPVLWVRDAKVVIPARWKGAVMYHLRELAALRKPSKPDQEELRRLHQAKKLFGGEIGAEPELDGNGKRCYSCGGDDFWVSRWGRRVCRTCHPPPPGAEVVRDGSD